MHGDIDKLIRFIAEKFTFDEDTYPELKGKNEAERSAFAIKHLALHLAKISGKIAAVSERVDHGKEGDISELKSNVPKALMSTLRLAELVGMSEQDIVGAVEEKYKGKIS